MKDTDIERRRNNAVMARKLQTSMRGIKYILKIIKHSFEIDIDALDAEQSAITDQYNENIESLLDNLCVMMSKTEPKFIAVHSRLLSVILVIILEAINNASSTKLDTSHGDDL
eukprot:TRINITY_DN20412_c0_g1_i1.p1 TRINITY_DN20412_c0_g1~~TRINITY_DN20412_c0_g1_i1.p1  ORF type:complete len:121 (+),score=13.17 TRINITY_DN20412_c0_g1_i1:25-363(+)